MESWSGNIEGSPGVVVVKRWLEKFAFGEQDGKLQPFFVHPQLVLLGLLPVSTHHSVEQVLLDEDVLVNGCLQSEQLHNKKPGVKSKELLTHRSWFSFRLGSSRC